MDLNSTLIGFSKALADVVEQAAKSIVRVDDGSRLTATGIVWSADGLIVTTSHGVERDDELAVELSDGNRHVAELAGRDPDTDVALLRVTASELSALPHADPNAVRVGSLAIALGRPGRSALEATLGLVSARYETETNARPGYLLHTDADLHPGFSGGALIGVDGTLYGLNNLMYGRGRGVSISPSVIEQVVLALQSYGRVRRGYLGIRSQPVKLPQSLHTLHGERQETGLLIVNVEAESPAEKSGLMLGDALLRIDGTAMQDGDELRKHLRLLHSGQEVSIDLIRGGLPVTVAVVLGAQE